MKTKSETSEKIGENVGHLRKKLKLK